MVNSGVGLPYLSALIRALAAVESPKSGNFAKEDELEEWIAHSPEILGENLLIIARQLIVPGVGRLDLLAMDQSGKLVIVELKRDLLPRQAVAQGLDYASWLSNASEEEITAYANHYLQEQSGDTDQSLPDAFEQHFGVEMPEWVVENHRILLVAAGLDSSAERIINYLAQKQIGINAIFFNYCVLNDHKQILVRSVLVPQKCEGTWNRNSFSYDTRNSDGDGCCEEDG